MPVLENKGADEMKPKRIQRKRTKGWRTPAAIYVGRATKWGNPFTMVGCRAAGYGGTDAEIARRCVGAFRVWLCTPHWRENWDSDESAASRAWMLDHLHELRGHDLACFCPPDRPCHADVLLEIANKEPAK